WLLRLPALGHGQEVEPAWLAGTLWPESAEPQAYASLRRCLTDLRTVLGPEAWRLRSPAVHRLCLDLTDAWVDLVTFDAAIGRGDDASLEAAVALHRGPLLEGCTEEWLRPERRSGEEARRGALERLAARAPAAGNAPAAAARLRQVVAQDPLREPAWRALMEALAASGSPAAATEA